MREDFQQYSQVALHTALAFPGLTTAEYSVMNVLTEDYCATPEEVAEMCLVYNPEAIIETYLDAVDSLVTKEYAYIVDAASIHSLRAEIEQEEIPSLDSIVSTNCFQSGDVDLTPAGYLVYCDILKKIYHDIDYFEAGWVDDEQGVVSIYSMMGSRGMDARVGQAVRHLYGDGKRIKAFHLPVSIGRWRPNRFITHPSGCCVRIEYLIDDPLPDI